MQSVRVIIIQMYCFKYMKTLILMLISASNKIENEDTPQSRQSSVWVARNNYHFRYACKNFSPHLEKNYIL